MEYVVRKSYFYWSLKTIICNGFVVLQGNWIVILFVLLLQPLRSKCLIPFLKSLIFPSGPTQERRNKLGGELICLYTLMYLKNVYSLMKVHRFFLVHWLLSKTFTEMIGTAVSDWRLIASFIGNFSPLTPNNVATATWCVLWLNIWKVMGNIMFRCCDSLPTPHGSGIFNYCLL